MPRAKRFGRNAPPIHTVMATQVAIHDGAPSRCDCVCLLRLPHPSSIGPWMAARAAMTIGVMG